ncbi:cytochrome P450 CYP82D47-like [Benincasa hispida]|uniref:cytochrome P450 CYP82D47-like n=1 Tax=Benincasa hispida TaxID=102211 RepID=UPI0018FF54EB|nr:cytochrome P450 CYP82D47-like [Benincasa hispida]
MEVEAMAELTWNNNQTTVLMGLSILVAIILFRLVMKRVTNNTGGVKGRRNPKPPMVGGGWPLIRHLPLFGGPEPPHLKLSALADKYGPIFSIQLGTHSAVVINNWEAAKQCFTTHDIAVFPRPKLLSGKLMGYNYAMFIFSPYYNSYWRKMRKITTLDLLSNRRLKLLRQVRESEVNRAIKELYQLGGRVEMKQWFGDLIMNLVLLIVGGKRYFGAGAMVEEEEAQRCQKAMEESLRLLGMYVLGDAIPYLGWLDVGGHVKAMKRTFKVLDGMLTQWLEEHKKNRAGKNNGDFMDVMLSVLEETDNDILHGFHRDTVIKATCLTMVLGASETSIVAVVWALSLLLNNRDTLRKVQEELDTHIGRDAKLQESDMEKLVYLEAVVKEAMRLFGAGSLISREAAEDIDVDGFHIKKGTWLFINLWKIHRDERVWDEPLKFKPERFLTTHKNFDVKGGQQFELIPFGGGRRICPGLWFGLQLVEFVLGGLLHAFDIWTPEDAAVDMTGTIGMTNMKATPLEVFIKPRLSPMLYESTSPY